MIIIAEIQVLAPVPVVRLIRRKLQIPGGKKPQGEHSRKDYKNVAGIRLRYSQLHPSFDGRKIPCKFGFRKQESTGLLASEDVLFGVQVEFVPTFLRAEIIFSALVIDFVPGFFFVHQNLAHWVSLHGYALHLVSILYYCRSLMEKPSGKVLFCTAKEIRDAKLVKQLRKPLVRDIKILDAGSFFREEK